VAYFRAVDFERDDLGERLAGVGFQQNPPAFFTWLGVVPYLTQEAIGNTLDYMESIQNSEVVFDYMEPPEAFSEEFAELVTERTKQLEKIDERWASRFEPAGIEASLRSHGFCDIEDINFQEISPGSAALFKGSRTERLVLMWSTLNTTQAAKRGAHGNITDCRPRSERNEQASCVVAHSDFMCEQTHSDRNRQARRDSGFPAGREQVHYRGYTHRNQICNAKSGSRQEIQH
jgi:hypothetical protein